MSKKTNLKSWLIIPVLLLLILESAFAGQIIYVDADATGSDTGTSWANAYVYLQNALSDANTSAKPVEIRVAQSTYKPDEGTAVEDANRTETFQLINDVTLKGGYAGYNEPDPNARDIEIYETILSGDLDGNDVGDLELEDPSREENSYHVVTSNGTDANAILDGFTITGGNANGYPNHKGGGMYNYEGNPIVTNCTFRMNKAVWGGGMYNVNNANPTVINCTFSSNYASMGSGMYCDECSPTITNCIIKDNRTESDGGGMFNHEGSPTVTGCTFSNNSADGFGGGGISNVGGSNPTITNCMFSGNTVTGRYGSGGGIANFCGPNTTLINCVFRGNSATGEWGAGGGIANLGSRTTLTNCTFVENWALYGKALLNVAVCDGGSPGEVKSTNTIFWDGGEEIYEYIPSSTITVTHSDVQGSWTGAGNIDTDPCFADANDFHLKSQAGRWNPTTENWVIDAVTSPCVDAGDMSNPISYEPFPNGGRINMGAYGGTEQASKSYFGTPPCETIVAGDINGDCKVNFLDFAIMTGHWLWEE